VVHDPAAVRPLRCRSSNSRYVAAARRGRAHGSQTSCPITFVPDASSGSEAVPARRDHLEHPPQRPGFVPSIGVMVGATADTPPHVNTARSRRPRSGKDGVRKGRRACGPIPPRVGREERKPCSTPPGDGPRLFPPAGIVGWREPGQHGPPAVSTFFSSAAATPPMGDRALSDPAGLGTQQSVNRPVGRFRGTRVSAAPPGKSRLLRERALTGAKFCRSSRQTIHQMPGFPIPA